MKLYIDVKDMTFDEDGIEREIVTKVKNVEFYGYDYIIELSDDDDFIKNTMEIEYEHDKNGNIEKILSILFRVNEQTTWWSFPLYQIIDGKIVPFDYTQYQYFTDTDRRMALAKKIGKLYNPSSEIKMLRTTIKRLLDNLEITDEKFEKYNTKVEQIIEKNPK